VFFDSEAGSLVEDAVVLFDPDDPGGGVNRFEVIAGESTLLSLDADVMAGDTNVGLTGLAMDPDTEDLYLLLVGTPTNSYFIARIPKANGVGNDDYASPELFAAASTIPSGGGFAHRLTMDARPATNELVLLIDTTLTAEDTTLNGVYTRPVTASPATAPNSLVANFATLAAALTPAATPGTDEIGFAALALVGTEDHVVHNAFGTGANDGDWVVHDVSTGTPSLWRENDIAAGEVALTNFPNGDVAVFITNTGISPFNDDLLRLDSAGNIVRLIATQSEMGSAEVSMPTNLNVSSGALFAPDDLTVYLFQSNVEEALLEVVDTEVPARLSSFFTD
jgi:hypothetical protein